MLFEIWKSSWYLWLEIMTYSITQTMFRNNKLYQQHVWKVNVKLHIIFAILNTVWNLKMAFLIVCFKTNLMLIAFVLSDSKSFEVAKSKMLIPMMCQILSFIVFFSSSKNHVHIFLQMLIKVKNNQNILKKLHQYYFCKQLALWLNMNFHPHSIINIRFRFLSGSIRGLHTSMHLSMNSRSSAHAFLLLQIVNLLSTFLTRKWAHSDWKLFIWVSSLNLINFLMLFW